MATKSVSQTRRAAVQRAAAQHNESGTEQTPPSTPVPEGGPNTGEAPATDPTSQLFDIINNLATTVNVLAEDVKKLKERPLASVAAPATPVVAGETPAVTPASTAVPYNLLTAAREVLGEKFDFRCEASPDLPMFSFTVIVPAEYSPLHGKAPDLRTRMISQAEGANGVRTWCMLVRQNVVKYLGKQLPIAQAAAGMQVTL